MHVQSVLNCNDKRARQLCEISDYSDYFMESACVRDFHTQVGEIERVSAANK